MFCCLVYTWKIIDINNALARLNKKGKLYLVKSKDVLLTEKWIRMFKAFWDRAICKV